MRNGGQVFINKVIISRNKSRDGGAIAMSGGRLEIGDGEFINNIAEQSAGAIYARGGTVNISDSRFEKNCATSMISIVIIGGTDRDSFSVDADGCPHIEYIRGDRDSVVPSNIEGGGAIRLVNGARAAVESSTFIGNKATYGGAIATAGGSTRLSVRGSSFVSNVARGGGGALGAPGMDGGSVSIRSSSFVENSAEGYSGGAIETFGQKLDIANSTFSENSANNEGGALYINETSEVTITHATFVDNRSIRNQATAIRSVGGRAYLRNSIIVSSTSGEACVGIWDQNLGNLSSDGTCAERPSDDPRLGELTGSPAYYPLRDRSPAIDYADPDYCLETDQLGTPRPQSGGCDIGAIEARGAIAAEPTPVPPLVCTLAFQIIAANRDQPASGCPAGSGVDTIVLDRNITLFEPLPPITSHIVIEGNGHSISGNQQYRIFDVDGGALTVNNLTMTEGYSSTDQGGAIRLLNGGRAEVNDSLIIKNSARIGGAAYISWQGTDHSRLTLNRTRLIENRALSDSNGGGAIYAGGGTIAVNSSSFAGNSAGFGNGSAILLINSRTRLDIVNSSFISKGSTSLLAVENGVTVTLTNVTIHAPHANAGALHIIDGGFDKPGTFNLRNSIIVGALHSAVCDNLKQNIGNLIANGSCSPRLSGDPLLEEPDDSSTHLELLPGSPAINAADERFCPETDQLGRARSPFGRCDIGAIEAVPVSQAVSDCTVTTTHGLNFRDGPGGNRIGVVPHNTTLSAVARTPRWFEVEYEGASGWISADYVVEEGDCELE